MTAHLYRARNAAPARADGVYSAQFTARAPSGPLSTADDPIRISVSVTPESPASSGVPQPIPMAKRSVVTLRFIDWSLVTGGRLPATAAARRTFESVVNPALGRGFGRR